MATIRIGICRVCGKRTPVKADKTFGSHYIHASTKTKCEGIGQECKRIVSTYKTWTW